jgi:peptidyl-prolyl cis-trans isomerase SurA
MPSALPTLRRMAFAAGAVLLAAAGPAPAGKARPEIGPSTGIVAVVNGDVITSADVSSRGRLFALSSGIPVNAETLARLRPQITRQLVDEKLRLQEIQRRRIVINDKQIAESIRGIEARNNMPPGMLRARLSADGTGQRTLIDQIRVQIGWTQVLRQALGDKGPPSAEEVAEQQRLQEAQAGKPEYHLLEIFIPAQDAGQTADAERFAETVVAQLRAGAPFSVVAAQFSQSQTALQGGDLGWLPENQIDPEVLAVARQMPIGAISNALKVPGGYAIAALAGRREVGREQATILNLRQTFLPFGAPLNPQAPTDAQRQVLERAKNIAASVRTCDAMEAANTAAGATRPANPGELHLEQVSPPPFRQMLATLPLDRASQPIVSTDGIAIVIVCSRELKNVSTQSKQEIENRMFGERIELLSRQLQRDLHRRANIELRTGAA